VAAAEGAADDDRPFEVDDEGASEERAPLIADPPAAARRREAALMTEGRRTAEGPLSFYVYRRYTISVSFYFRSTHASTHPPLP
jgi:hypothetical protein